VPTKNEIKKSLLDLVAEGAKVVAMLSKESDKAVVEITASYQPWYTQALPTVKRLAPDRYPEFTAYYDGSTKGTLKGPADFGIRHYLIGISLNPYQFQGFDPRDSALTSCFGQVLILKSLKLRIDSALADIEGALFAGLAGAELQTAAELMKVNLRAAGVVAGVVLESHLQKIASNHRVKSRKKKPGIGVWNEALKEAKVYATPVWRRIQLLGDLRNLCCHKNEDEPTRSNVKDLLDGVSWVCANLS
jgi:hypothetical protein